MHAESKSRIGRIGSVCILSAALALVGTAPTPAQALPPTKAKKKAKGVKPQVVRFETTDRVTIEADYYAPKSPDEKGAPTAILIHMYPADRSSWKPLVAPLRKAGFAILAYDIRGKGGSVEPADKELERHYKEKDPGHFREAWRDVRAAKKWLSKQEGCDTSRIALIGASVGCSIALDYGSQDSTVKAIVCLSPGTNYMGLDSISRIKRCKKRAMLLMSPKSEYGAVEELIEASDGVAEGKQYRGTRKQHGTKLLDSADGKKVKRQILTFLKEAFPSEKDTKKKKQKQGKKKPRARGI